MASTPKLISATNQPTAGETTAPGMESFTETVTGYTTQWQVFFGDFSSAWRQGLDSNAIAEAVLAVLVVLTNGLVVFTIIRPRNKDRLRTPLNLLIAHLAIVDLLVGAIAEPFTIYSIVDGLHSEPACIFYLVWALALSKASLIGFVLVSVERFIAIRFPLKYKDIFTTRNSTLIWLPVWAFSLCYGLVPTLAGMDQNWNPRIGCFFKGIIPLDYLFWFGTVGTYTVECIIIICIYIYLLAVVRRQIRQIASLQVPQSTSAAGDGLVKKYSRRELTVALRCLLMIFAHFICRWPLAFNNLLEWQGIRLSYESVLRLVWLSRINSLINPLCYAYANTKLRRELVRMLPCPALRTRLAEQGTETQNWTGPDPEASMKCWTRWNRRSFVLFWKSVTREAWCASPKFAYLAVRNVFTWHGAPLHSNMCCSIKSISALFFKLLWKKRTGAVCNTSLCHVF